MVKQPLTPTNVVVANTSGEKVQTQTTLVKERKSHSTKSVNKAKQKVSETRVAQTVTRAGRVSKPNRKYMD